MIDKKEFRNNFDSLSKSLECREIGKDELLKIKNLDEQHLVIKKNIDELNAKRNSLAKENGKLHQEAIRQLKEEINLLNQKELLVRTELNAAIHLIPNIPSSELTPEQKTVFEWGKPEDKGFNPLSHIELCEACSIISFPKAINVAGAGYCVYIGDGEKLIRALIWFTLDENEAKGYVRHFVPEIVSESSLFCTSQISKFSDTVFKLVNQKFLSPTSEVQLVNLYRNTLLEEKQLPLKLTANTNCFRNESVGAGVESKGLIRMYQFNKTELVVICKDSESEQIHQQVTLDAESILQKLNLPYRKVLLANNDLGFSSSKTYDLEVWIPSENKYREISSTSNTLDFQARRGSIRWKKDLFNKEEKAKLAHIINGSSLAIDRLFVAIVENYQDKDGNIRIPEALKPYLNIDIIKPV